MRAPGHATWLVRDWMRSPAVTVRPMDSIAHARAVCEERRINQLPVVKNRTLVGIVTDRDLRDAFPSVADEARDPKGVQAQAASTTVESVMSANVLVVEENDTVARAAELMQTERIGALPVMKGGDLVGIVTRSDLLRALVALVKPSVG
jgi:acetoin utilization protein AcuB